MSDHAEKTTLSGTGTLGKAIALLEIVTASEKPLRFTEILERSCQPRGTLHRQLMHLVEEGLIEQSDDQTYVAGLRLLTFASRAWNGSDLRSIAAPHLRKLQEQTGESVHLGLLRGAEIIYLDKIDGKHAVRMHSQIGRVSPAYCTGVGKAALSLLSEVALDSIIATIGFQSYTPKTIISATKLKQEISIIQRCGYGFDLEEHETGIQCIAVPLHLTGRQYRAAISVTGPAYRLSQERLEGWAGIVIEAARNIAEDILVRMSPAHA